MNIKRIFTWISFIVIIGLIIWGLVAAQKKDNREKNLLPLPDQIVSTDHIYGNIDAPVTIVEYGDFQCPACGVFFPIVKETLNQVGSTTARFVFRHFPLQQHPNAIPAALASEAAHLQGKFWDMYDMLYVNQEEWSNEIDAVPIFVEYAKKLQLDTVKFELDMKLPELEKIVTDGYKSGVKADIRATPTFFINGKQIDNPQSVETFKKIIEDANKSSTNS